MVTSSHAGSKPGSHGAQLQPRLPARTADAAKLDGASSVGIPARCSSSVRPACCHDRPSKVGWASKERSTPEGYNREEHAWRFESPFPQGMSTSSIMDAYEEAFPAPVVIRPPKKKKSPEETQITVKCLFFEFGGPYYHYNFTAYPENSHPADGCTKLFFSEINCALRSEDDVLLCCIVGDKDAGHCHACEDLRPMMVHPSSRAYGGGNTTAIDYPDEDSSSSDSDY
ncbi:uncharacterized protein [Miscanthus floridulus]|uniref:uncharacterized protein n=1 Tax=Miscanthus floridulus TaxID=154761 RepID=UPI003459E4A8